MILLFLLLCGAIAGNYFKLPLYFKLDILFGSIATMIILQLFGLRWGLFSAVVSGVSCWFLWAHLFSGVNFVFEAAFVGYLYSRRRKGLVLLSASYWICLGMPLAWIYFDCYRSMTMETAFLIMLKQGVNGIVNTLAAKLIVTMLPIFRPVGELAGKRQVSFQQIISTTLASCVVFPLLSLTMLTIREEYQDEMANLSRELTHVTDHSKEAVQTWLRERLTVFSTLAQFRGSPDILPDLQKYIGQVNQSNKSILEIGLVDRHGRTIVYDPPVDTASGKSNIGISLADEARLQAIRASRQPIVSDVMHSGQSNQPPVVSVAAPVFSAHGFDGYATGTLDLQSASELLARISRDWSCTATLLDGNRRVLANSDPSQQVLKRFEQGKGKKISVDHAIYQWIPHLQGNDNSSERLRRSYYFKEIPVGLDTSWRLVVGLPTAPRLHYIDQLSTKQLFFMMVWTILTLAFADLVGRRLATSLNKLREATTGLPDVISRQTEIAWPTSLISDVTSLIDNFKAVYVSLSKKFGELTVMNRDLSSEIHERSVAEGRLRQATLELNGIFQAFPDHCLVMDAQATILDCRGGKMQDLSLGGSELRGRRIAEIFPPEVVRQYHGAFEEVLATGAMATFEYRLTGENGASFFEARLVPLSTEQIVVIVRNVTDLKQAEQLRTSHEQLRNLSMHLERARENERALIAREIHDELGQRLTALRFDLGWVGKRLAPEESIVSGRVQSMSQLVDGTIRTVRRIAMELRPRLLDDLGLVAAMEWQVTEFEERTGIVCVLHMARGEVAVEQMRATAIFRILQEALTNIIRHAEATRVDVTFAKEKGMLILKVVDNGRGIAQDQVSGTSSFGIMGMNERAREWNGTVAVTGRPGKGTTITVDIPAGDEEG
jgi:signal transduction histidine kinase